MTVWELINELSRFDDYTEVVIARSPRFGSEYANGVSIVTEESLSPYIGRDRRVVRIGVGDQVGAVYRD